MLVAKEVNRINNRYVEVIRYYYNVASYVARCCSGSSAVPVINGQIWEAHQPIRTSDPLNVCPLAFGWQSLPSADAA